MLKETAQNYREKYAKNCPANFSLTRIALVSFLRYIAPSIILLLAVTFTLFSFDVSAEPQGFSSQSVQRAAPKGFGLETTTRNTVEGVLKKGHNRDYVLLEGMFVEPLDNSMQRFSFADASGDTIEIRLAHKTSPFPDKPYYIWGRIQTSLLGSSKINVIDYTLVN